MIEGIGDSARLLRGFAADFLTSHDVREVERIMDPAYALSIGGFVLDGRDDAYLPATRAQLEQFPGLVVTVHDVVIGLDAVAMRFTEHGVSVRSPGRAAAWGGVTLFRLEGGRLRQGWAEEDYFARKRQLRSGVVDAIRAPHPCPWDVPCLGSDAATEAVAQAWLADPAAPFDVIVDQVIVEGPRLEALVAPSTLRVTTLFSAGPRAAFHSEWHGSYAGGFDDIDRSLNGAPVVMNMAGLLTVRDRAVVEAQISADRLGLHRQLLDMSRV